MQTTAVCRVLVFLTALVQCNVVNSLFEGDQCFHKKKNINGVCKVLESCQGAIADLMSGVFPENCGFSGNTVIVCCADASPPRPPPPPTMKVGDKTRNACKSYEKYGYRKIRSPTGFSNDEIDEDICPWTAQAIQVIIDGEKTTKGEFPHMALIGYGSPGSYAWKCGGTLISEKFVLTAAHCLLARDLGEPKVVRLGDNNYTDPNDDQHTQQINVLRYHKHPGYKFPVQYHDLALLELQTPANLNLYVKPACIGLEDSSSIQKGIITGWGNTEAGGNPSEVLLKAAVEVFPPDICNKTYRNDRRSLPQGVNPELQLCFGSSKNRKDSCQGDSGGPIQIYHRSVHCSYEVFGVTSFGKGCGKVNIPAGYVKLNHYIDWIEKTVWP